MPEDIKEIITTIGAYILKLADKGDNLEENKLKILENIKNGKAYNKFLELVQNQNGDIEYVKNTDKFTALISNKALRKLTLPKRFSL